MSSADCLGSGNYKPPAGACPTVPATVPPPLTRTFGGWDSKRRPTGAKAQVRALSRCPPYGVPGTGHGPGPTE